MQTVCSECGTLHPPDSKFCNKCGAPLETAKGVQEAKRTSDIPRPKKSSGLFRMIVMLLTANILLACGLGAYLVVDRGTIFGPPEDTAPTGIAPPAEEAGGLIATPTGTPEPPSPVAGKGRIAFASNRGNWDIYVINTDGSALTRLTDHPGGDFYPSWSPDGRHIAFGAVRQGNDEIYVMNSDGSGQTNLTNNPASDQEPAWSPDGKWIAFDSDRDEVNPDDCYPNCNYEIYVLNVNGRGVTRLTNHPASDLYPSWSPDGKRIAFESDRNGNWEIYVMNADGSEVTNLTQNQASDYAASWSPDGRRLAFQSSRSGNEDIYVMNADGSEVICLTNNPASDWYPSWSPDGKRIAFESDRNGNPDIYIMNSDGSGVIRLVDNPAYDSQPSWSP
jgi:Tol biopolymer transport system component